MEQEETTLHIELIVGITDQIGLSVADRLEQTDVDVVDHSLTADPAWDYERCFDIDL